MLQGRRIAVAVSQSTANRIVTSAKKEGKLVGEWLREAIEMRLEKEKKDESPPVVYVDGWDWKG